jgi:hypothetical protein
LSLRSALTVFVLVGVVVVACGGSAVCRDLGFSATAQRDFAELSRTTPSHWTPPCAFDSALEITGVFVDMLPGAQAQPRMSFVVTRSGTPAFIFSQTTAEIPFSAIPQGTHRLRVQAGSILAEGFAGPSGTGSDTAYLRWRDESFTFELSAVLSAWQRESNIVSLARGLMKRLEEELSAEAPFN